MNKTLMWFILVLLLVEVHYVGGFLSSRFVSRRSYFNSARVDAFAPTRSSAPSPTATTTTIGASLNPITGTSVGNKAYGAEAITVLEGLDPVRKRPGMYIGSTGVKGLHHLVFEVIDNCVDEALAGHCKEISLALNADGTVEVEDDGRGIPCGIHPATGKSALETVLCVLHAGGKFGGDGSGYKVSGGLHGVGISVVNALSDRLDIEVCREGSSHKMHFEKGIPKSLLEITALSSLGLSESKRGTKVIFKPDPSIFKTTVEFDYDRLRSRIDELAYLNAGLSIRMFDRRHTSSHSSPSQGQGSSTVNEQGDEDQDGVLLKLGKKAGVNVGEHQGEGEEEEDLHDKPVVTRKGPKEEHFRHDGGIQELVVHMCDSKQLLHEGVPYIGFTVESKGVVVDVALRWSKDLYTDNIVGFANGIRTSDGGSHMDGLKAAITKALNAGARKGGKLLKDGQPNIPGEFLREGLTAVVSVKVPEPEFEGQTKARLGNPEVRQIVDSVVQEAFGTVLEWNPEMLAQIVGKALQAQAAAVAARAARDMVRRKTLLTSTVLPGKLADCSSRDPEETEIYIVEGDSAAGSAKQGRQTDSSYPAPAREDIEYRKGNHRQDICEY